MLETAMLTDLAFIQDVGKRGQKGLGRQLIFLCGWHGLDHDGRSLCDAIWTKDMQGRTESCPLDRDQVGQECRNERD
jgi:hypothetical protein